MKLAKFKVTILITSAILALVIAALYSFLNYSTSLDLKDVLQNRYIRYISWFSFKQAILSSIIAITGSVAVAIALYRRSFIGKKLLLNLFALTYVLPVLVAVFGIIAIYGNSGFIKKIFELKFNLYGLNGILLAHVFFNLPLSCRILYQSLTNINQQQHLLAWQLGLNSFTKFKILEWPIIKEQLPAIFSLVFMLCFSSFTCVMALGGGPKATTLEVAIYQSIRYDFDLPLAAILSIWQIIICISLFLFLNPFNKNITSQEQSKKYKFKFIDSRLTKTCDALAIILSALLVLPPLIAIILAGCNNKLFTNLFNYQLWSALKNSLTIGFLAALIATISATFILLSSSQLKLNHKQNLANHLEFIGSIILVIPSIVLSTALFLLLHKYTNIFNGAFILVIIINAIMALPFAMRSLAQPLYICAKNYNLLCQSLGLQGFNRFKSVEFKALKPHFATAFATCMILSIGDLSAIAMFGSNKLETLPYLLYMQLSSYQMDSAAASALLLLIVSLGLFKSITANNQR